MLKISKKDITELYRLEILSEIHALKDKIAYFEKKYDSSFNKFEKKVKKNKEENFSEWDDYLEWKAYRNTFNYKAKEIKEIENENFQFIG